MVVVGTLKGKGTMGRMAITSAGVPTVDATITAPTVTGINSVTSNVN